MAYCVDCEQHTFGIEPHRCSKRKKKPKKKTAKKKVAKKRSFLVRLNCEYSYEVEAADEDEAIKKAEAVDVKDWDQAWSPIEVEDA